MGWHEPFTRGATPTALVRAAVPPPPEYPADPDAAYGLHEASFHVLEQLAGGHATSDELATAALEELCARRRDMHTLLAPRGRFSGS